MLIAFRASSCPKHWNKRQHGQAKHLPRDRVPMFSFARAEQLEYAGELHLHHTKPHGKPSASPTVNSAYSVVPCGVSFARAQQPEDAGVAKLQHQEVRCGRSD
jgi:hypothetical protein